MNKFALALAMGTGLTLSLAVPTVNATPIIESLSPQEVSSGTFNSLFQAIDNAPVMTQSISLANKDGLGQTAGTISSEVFKGTGAADGLYAYAYQLAVSPNAVDSTTSTPMHLDGTSFIFNGNPVATTVLGGNSSSFLVKDGTIGGLTPMSSGVAPDSLSFQVDGDPSKLTGSLRANFVDPKTGVPPLNPGDNSATFVVISKQPFSQSFVNVTSSTPQVGALTAVYAADGVVVSPVPAPEPTTIIAWAGMAGTLALVRRVRKSRTPVA
jgi:hypothetical protein